MAVDLIFSEPGYTGPGNAVDLVFGATADAGGNTTARLTIDLSAPPVLAMRAGTGIAYSVALDLSDLPVVSVAVTYDLGVSRGPRLMLGATWENAATPFEVIASSLWESPLPFPVSTSQRIVDALRIPGASHAAVWEEGNPTRISARTAYEEAALLRSRDVAVRYQEGAPSSLTRASGWEEAAVFRVPTTTARYQETNRLRSQVDADWQEAKPVRGQITSVAHDAAGLLRSWVVPWQEGKLPPPGKTILIPPEPPVDLCYTPPLGDAVDLVFNERWTGAQDTDLVFVCDNHPPLPPATITVPIREVYMVSNNVSLTLADGTLVPTTSFTLSLDYQSWTWGMNATVAYAALSMFGFDVDGDPVEVWAHINGETFKLFVQAGGSTRTFPAGSVSLTGIGLISTLDAPYSPTLTFDNAASDENAQQIANQVLTDNGVSIGWAVEWGMTDWMVPAGAWSFQGTYATALQAIAAAAGGYLQPHPTDLTARILPLYPTAPWEWDTVTPDYELPSAVTQTEGITWSSQPSYNAVWVSGTNASGVLAEVKRTGTAGDLLATMVTDQLITHADAARQRGTAILGNTGRQALVSLRLPVLAETGVILPGKFVRYVDGGTSRVGIVRSVSVEVAFPAVWQTIGVETHVS